MKKNKNEIFESKIQTKKDKPKFQNVKDYLNQVNEKNKNIEKDKKLEDEKISINNKDLNNREFIKNYFNENKNEILKRKENFDLKIKKEDLKKIRDKIVPLKVII
jgi:hypothetical protein